MRFLSIFPLAGFLAIILLIGIKTVSLKWKGISLGAGRSYPTGGSLALYLLFLLILLAWLTALASQTFNFYTSIKPSILTMKLVESPVLAYTGAFIVFVSVMLMGFTLVHFKKSLRFGLNENNQGELITAGIFAFSRNPFFLSLDLYFIGQAFIFPGIVFIAIALLTVAGIHRFILKEENFLHMHYGDQYSRYVQKVRRYF